ncbi:hypothetical protein PQX77_021315 [Marasmius sp. AFHP31]|nr:hypothetical protein PQX77_021315 [Marasmius sp. AFHP31]
MSRESRRKLASVKTRIGTAQKRKTDVARARQRRIKARRKIDAGPAGEEDENKCDNERRTLSMQTTFQRKVNAVPRQYLGNLQGAGLVEEHESACWLPSGSPTHRAAVAGNCPPRARLSDLEIALYEEDKDVISDEETWKVLDPGGKLRDSTA